MKPVVQLERTGCGIASVAALAGVSYRETQRLANRLGIFSDDPKLWSETGYVRRLLKEYGIRSARTEMSSTSWEALPDLALLAVNGTKKGIGCSGIGSSSGEGLTGLSCSTQNARYGLIFGPTSSA
jgi:hypothetical protein